jgi:hypothetical protein
MVWHHHHHRQFCRTVPSTLVIQLAVFTLSNPCILHTLQSLHFFVVFSDLRLTLSKYFSFSCTVFYFSTLLCYHFSPLSALCTVHTHFFLQFLVSGQLKNKNCSTRTAVWTVSLPSPLHSQLAVCTRSIPFLHVQYNIRYHLLACCLLCYEQGEIFCT